MECAILMGAEYMYSDKEVHRDKRSLIWNGICVLAYFMEAALPRLIVRLKQFHHTRVKDLDEAKCARLARHGLRAVIRTRYKAIVIMNDPLRMLPEPYDLGKLEAKYEELMIDYCAGGRLLGPDPGRAQALIDRFDLVVGEALEKQNLSRSRLMEAIV